MLAFLSILVINLIKTQRISAIIGKNVRYLLLKFGILVSKSTILSGKSMFYSILCTFRQKYPYTEGINEIKEK